MTLEEIGNQTISELEVRVGVLEGTIADHETRISATEADINSKYCFKCPKNSTKPFIHFVHEGEQYQNPDHSSAYISYYSTFRFSTLRTVQKILGDPSNEVQQQS